ncbi:MAG: heme ABC transporter ATP-binding protein [Pseudomonadota bacterium]|nr:heme ABC transporter ATP-binding protein [Pseudomonadota bacterium]
MSVLATDVRVRLGRTQILHGVDLTARAGEVTCIVGPNGSGKTTLMKALTGEIPYDGRIELEGQDVARLTPDALARLRGVLPQASALSFPFTVQEVVSLGLLDRRDPRPVRHALAQVGLLDLAARFYQDLSGGQKQRVQLARVLTQIGTPVWHGGARWLFLDEPVSALDIAHQVQVMQIARDFALGGGGVIAIMHDLNLTAMFADHVIVLRDGAVLASGSVAQTIRPEVLEPAYGCRMSFGTQPGSDIPVILPLLAPQEGAADRAGAA